MSAILSIETATEICSVALARDGELIACKESANSNEHSSLLTLFIQEVMEEAGISLKALDAVAVSKGPGSYTGLRIGVSAAKGLCYSLDKPLIAVSTLKALAYQTLSLFPDLKNPQTLLCPMIDARRMEVFTALYNQHLEEVSRVDALILDQHSFDDFNSYIIAICGNGAGKCTELFSGSGNIIFPGNVRNSANAISSLATSMFHNKEFVDTAYFEPYYLKDFIAGKPKVKGLHG